MHYLQILCYSIVLVTYYIYTLKHGEGYHLILHVQSFSAIAHCGQAVTTSTDSKQRTFLKALRAR